MNAGSAQHSKIGTPRVSDIFTPTVIKREIYLKFEKINFASTLSILHASI